MRSYIADNIMKEYNRQKKRKENKERAELESFKKEVCLNCKNRNTNLCHIVKNIDGKFQCAFKQ